MLAQRRWSFEEYAMMQHGSFEVVEDAAGARDEVADESARVQEEVQVDGMQAQIQLTEGIQPDKQRLIPAGEQLEEVVQAKEGVQPDQQMFKVAGKQLEDEAGEHIEAKIQVKEGIQPDQQRPALIEEAPEVKVEVPKEGILPDQLIGAGKQRSRKTAGPHAAHSWTCQSGTRSSSDGPAPAPP